MVLCLRKHKKGKPVARRENIFVFFDFPDFFGAFVFYRMQEMTCMMICAKSGKYVQKNVQRDRLTDLSPNS